MTHGGEPFRRRAPADPVQAHGPGIKEPQRFATIEQERCRRTSMAATGALPNSKVRCPRPFSVAKPGPGSRDASLRRSRCADSAAVLGPGSRGRTRFVRFAHCVQTARASQSTKRAARADPGPALLIWTPPVWQASFASFGKADQLRSHIRPLDAARGPAAPSAGLDGQSRGWGSSRRRVQHEARPRSATALPTHGLDRFAITCSTPLAHSCGL